MGLINFGVPEKETEYLKKSMKLDVFVEGGTYKGGTAKSMSGKFRKVYTIEKSDVMFDIAKENLKDVSNITMLKGDTREHLHTILENNDNIIFWLDAHWSGGDTYGEEDECPLIEELEIIFEYPDKNQVILIDDARLFLAPPPYPHKVENWPSLTDILQTLPMNWELLELEDVIYLFPKSMNKEFKSFIQEITTDRWKQYGKSNQNSFLKGIKMAILGLLKGKF
jgi:16S rRNA G966 N2-methylase RsmD